MRREKRPASNRYGTQPAQAELPLGASTGKVPDDSLCPVYYPKTGEELQNLALRLGPILKKAGWEVQIRPGVQPAEDYLELCDLKNERKSRRLSPEELVAWQVILDQFSGNFDCLPGINLGLQRQHAATDSNAEKEPRWTTDPRPALKKR